MTTKHEDVERVLLSSEQIEVRVRELAAQLDKRFEGKEVVAICILKGSIVFFTDLIRYMQTPLGIDFVQVSSYGNGTVSTGKLSVKKDLSENIEGKHVLIVEDIVDSGNTLYYFKEFLERRNPASVTIVTLLDKPARRQTNVQVEYSCFEIEDEFVIGYGLDYAEKYRNLPYVGILKPSVYQN